MLALPVVDAATAAVCLMLPDIEKGQHQKAADHFYPIPYTSDEDLDPWALPELPDSSVQWSGSWLRFHKRCLNTGFCTGQM